MMIDDRIAPYWNAKHAVPLLFGARKVVSFGSTPFVGGQWQNETVPIAFDRRELAMVSGRNQFNKLCNDRKFYAMVDLLDLLERAFYRQCGRFKNPKGWQAFVLSSWFLRWTQVDDVPGQANIVALYLDATFSFRRLGPRIPR